MTHKDVVIRLLGHTGEFTYMEGAWSCAQMPHIACPSVPWRGSIGKP